MVYLGIVFIILAVANFGFAGYYFYESRKKADKISKETINKIGEEEKKHSGSSIIMKADNINFNQYNFSQVIKTINAYIDNFNKTNRNVNIATGIVSIIAAIVLIISGIIILN